MVDNLNSFITFTQVCTHSYACTHMHTHIHDTYIWVRKKKIIKVSDQEIEETENYVYLDQQISMCSNSIKEIKHPAKLG